MGTYKWFFPTNSRYFRWPFLLHDDVVGFQNWPLMGLPPGLRLPPGDCLLRIAITSRIASSGLRLPPGLPPQDWVWFHQGLKSSSMTKVTFCSCLMHRCWTRVPLHSSLLPQGVNLGRQFVRLTWQWWIAGLWLHNPQMGGLRLRMLVNGKLWFF